MENQDQKSNIDQPVVSTSYKLWVVGEHSDNPDDWSIWSEYSVVIAKDEKEACEMTGKSPAVEIKLDSAKTLATMTEPNWGDDL